MSRQALRRWSPVAGYWVALAAAALALVTTVGPDQRSGFRFSGPGDTVQLPTAVLPTQAAVVVLLVAAAALAAAVTWRASRGLRSGAAWLGGFSALLVAAFIVWDGGGQEVSLVVLLGGSLLLSVPLVFGAMSGVLCERSGVINIAIEGHLLAGAFASAVTASLTGNLYAGLLAAMIAGVLIAALLAVFAIVYVVDQIVLGFVINVLVVGLTSFLYGQVLAKDQDRWNSPDRLAPVKIPGLGDIPLIGPIFFNQTIILYAMYLLVIGLSFALFRTRWGLRVRSVGEHPKAADTAGLKVNAIRFRSVLYAGAVAGFGGAFFTIGRVGGFSEEMTAGQGFIALAALIFGRWTPLGAVGAALIFGFATNLQTTLAIIGTPIPGEFLLMAPYIVTIIAVAGLVGKVRAPAADGVAYKP